MASDEGDQILDGVLAGGGACSGTDGLGGLALGRQVGGQLAPGFGRALLVGEHRMGRAVRGQGPAALDGAHDDIVSVEEGPAPHRVVVLEVAPLLDDAAIEVGARLSVDEAPAVGSVAAAAPVEVGLLLDAARPGRTAGSAP